MKPVLEIVNHCTNPSEGALASIGAYVMIAMKMTKGRAGLLQASYFGVVFDTNGDHEYIVNYSLDRRQRAEYTLAHHIPCIDIGRVIMQTHDESIAFLITPPPNKRQVSKINGSNVIIMVPDIIKVCFYVDAEGAYLVHHERPEPYEVKV